MGNSDVRARTPSNPENLPESDDEDDHFQDAVDFAETIDVEDNFVSVMLKVPDSETSSTRSNIDPTKERLQRRITSMGILGTRKKTMSAPAKPIVNMTLLRANASDDALLADILEVEVALEMFLNSQFKEAEDLLLPKYGQSLYFTEGVALLRMLRAVMTFDPDDMSNATQSLGYASEVANVLRKVDSNGFLGIISTAAYVITGNKGPNHLSGMTRVQKHAELVYAECSCIQSLLKLIANTNLVNFVKEGIQMRASFTIIKACFRFLEKLYEEEGVEGFSTHLIDEHFTSGVIMTAGLFALTLSFLPEKIIKVFELIGFQGDRDIALDRLSTAAEWPFTPSIFVTGNPKSQAKFKSCFPTPPHKAGGASGGLRKPFSELALFSYHIILASLNPLPDCNLPLASMHLSKCLENRNQSFIYRALRARMLETEAKPYLAEIEYTIVISLQKDYHQLYHACLWDMGICQMAQGKWSMAYDGYTILFAESKWTRAVYRYMQAVTLYTQNPADTTRVSQMMAEVPSLLKKIAGFSMPMEKFVSRKSRKFLRQENRLLLPAYEILYFFHGIVMTSRDVLVRLVEDTTRILKELEEKTKYETYYDDFCLALFIRAVAEREIGFPSVKTLEEIKVQVALGRSYNSKMFADSRSSLTSDPSDVDINYLKSSINGFKKLISESRNIVLDHWMLLFGRYELGSLYMRIGQFNMAKCEFEAAQNKGVAKGDEDIFGFKKSSLENMLQVRCHNALLKLRALEENSLSLIF
ncbi:hypothetical protein HK100_010291 [Physocladia obscura]|uniref:Uncharacterized protein n=1 Tax=Physocladia obscura TaxID=109957 RepID=A0AAD5T3B9_9FUNG|nr:hypothetical protein HK100_010291 [Physocladia obscura]